MAKHRLTEEEYRRGLTDYHDPTASVGGAPPALSALTLRLWLAAFGLIFCAGAAVVTARVGLTLLAVVMALLAAIAAVDLAWVWRRKRRGEPG